MRVAVISDLHIDIRKQCAQKALLEACFRNAHADQMIICGDITEHASPDEWNAFFGMIKPYFDASQLCIIPGNMDRTEYDDGKNAYIREYQAYSGIMLDTLYVYRETDECMIIGLTPEHDDDLAPLSSTQISMLKDGIQRAGEKHMPALVFGHYALNQTIQADWKYAFLGEQSYAVRAILEQSGKNVYYFSGHIHRGLMSSPGGSMAIVHNVTYVSVPSISVPDSVHYNAENADMGTGYIADISHGRVTIQGYDFRAQKPIEGFYFATDP